MMFERRNWSAWRGVARLGALVLVLVMLAAVLAACGEGEVESGTGGAAATATESGDTATAVSTTPATSEAATPEADASAPRTVESNFGPIEVPGSPERVVTFGDLALDASVALGVTPVGASASRGAQGVATYMEEHAGDIKVIGTLAEPNLEVLVQLKPDIIIAESWITQELYDSFSKIAPTFAPVAPGGNTSDWQAATRGFGEALGRSDEAETVIEDVESRAAEVKAAVADHAGKSATVMRWMPQGPVVMASRLITGQMLTAVGLTLPEMANTLEGGHSDPLSLENLTEVDTDWLFVATLNADADAALEEARKQPAFQRLNAVKAEQVVAVNGQLWSSAAGPFAALGILDDIEKALGS